jgi:hypothetical protein
LATVMIRRMRLDGVTSGVRFAGQPLGITAIDPVATPSSTRIALAAGEFATTFVAHR